MSTTIAATSVPKRSLFLSSDPKTSSFAAKTNSLSLNSFFDSSPRGDLKPRLVCSSQPPTLSTNYEGSNSTFPRYNKIEAKTANPPVMPGVMTPVGPLDLSSVLFRNRVIFIGQPIYTQVAQRVISQLVTLASIDENADISIYLNCPGGSVYSVLAVYDCMSWIKPKVGTVAFGIVASQAALILAGGEKGMRYAMPNARIMVHQPLSGTGGHVEDVRSQVREAVHSRNKIDKMYAEFSGQPLEVVQKFTERDRFMSATEAMELGIIDGLLETRY